MKNILISQFIILLAGTLFAWGNFGYELYAWVCAGEKVGCAVGVVNPFYTPCFFGAIFFTLAFILSILSLKKHNK
ncbi:MAG: hypothetical protein V1851_03430 [Patescibacteria group bacterium]